MATEDPRDMPTRVLTSVKRPRYEAIAASDARQSPAHRAKQSQSEPAGAASGLMRDEGLLMIGDWRLRAATGARIVWTECETKPISWVLGLKMRVT